MPRYADVDRLMEHAITMDWSVLKWVNEVDISTAINPNVVKVVRCKDCKWHEWYIRSRLMNGGEYKSNECRKFNMAVTPDWFCADGERSENADNNQIQERF